uniref:Uncharacterized protein n=1 Tax=Chromera velia CCMP2878 TaxID=1169474 RepID=A0A0G4HX57_9ALVE|eukprot:Cvel_9194.t1-p1 / transcript=Cvel_9194.t1 / gene=Cvel_9194 / organism=Chromera_velia_CCMP2878 / gene_product=hypothetical protein / transcript_product=hypothetical protein / location=Cvel_scaffold524:10378-12126(-) / protein_length=310 / sequence_SO=supercontig / SO=protein_coding / is_pseudo=false
MEHWDADAVRGAMPISALPTDAGPDSPSDNSSVASEEVGEAQEDNEGEEEGERERGDDGEKEQERQEESEEEEGLGSTFGSSADLLRQLELQRTLEAQQRNERRRGRNPVVRDPRPAIETLDLQSFREVTRPRPNEVVHHPHPVRGRLLERRLRRRMKHTVSSSGADAETERINSEGRRADRPGEVQHLPSSSTGADSHSETTAPVSVCSLPLELLESLCSESPQKEPENPASAGLPSAGNLPPPLHNSSPAPAPPPEQLSKGSGSITHERNAKGGGVEPIRELVLGWMEEAYTSICVRIRLAVDSLRVP